MGRSARSWAGVRSSSLLPRLRCYSAVSSWACLASTYWGAEDSAMTSVTRPGQTQRWSQFDLRELRSPAALIFNPHAGQKLGIETNAGSADDVQLALQGESIPFDAWPTERAGHATDLARRAVAEGRQLVIGAGGDGTINEIARGLAQTDVVLGLMPLGSIM